jgi:hypothetical protein
MTTFVWLVAWPPDPIQELLAVLGRQASMAHKHSSKRLASRRRPLVPDLTNSALVAAPIAAFASLSSVREDPSVQPCVGIRWLAEKSPKLSLACWFVDVRWFSVRIQTRTARRTALIVWKVRFVRTATCFDCHTMDVLFWLDRLPMPEPFQHQIVLARVLEA